MSATANTFYIIVNKKDEKFEIDESNIDESSISTVSPGIAISGTTPFKVQVNVTTGNTTTGNTNSFTLSNGRTYTLVLDSAADSNAIRIKDINTFKAATPDKGMAGGSVVEDANNGGQKQKQQKSKRNYSKKRRSSKSKSDTLRNYFNYDHLQ